jgi:uncharacterized Zn finger protein
MSIPNELQITETLIQSHCGATSVSRGRPYYQQGAVVERTRTGNTLQAKCYGSTPLPYRLTVTLANQQILDPSCSCPVGGGGRCKHIAALLFAWLHEPETFSKIESLAALLDSRSKESLIQLIMQMVQREPDLESLIRLPPPQEPRQSLDAELIARQVRRILESSSWEYGSEYAMASEIDEVIEQGLPYLEAENIPNAVAVFATCAREVIDGYEDVYDHDGMVAGTLGTCGAYLADCLDATDDPSTRALILGHLFDIYMWDVNFGGIDVGVEAQLALVEQTTPEEKNVVIGWVRDQLNPSTQDSLSDWRKQTLGHFLLQLSADEIDDEQYLAICRQSGRHQDLIRKLLELKRIGEAVEAARPISGYDLWQLADDFVKQGYPQEIEALMFDHITGSDRPDNRALEWLVAHLRRSGRTQEALDLALQRYDWQRNLQSFIAVQEVAGDLNLRAETTQKMCAALQQASKYGLLVEVYIHEKEIDQALKNYERYRNVPSRGFLPGLSSLSLRLAQAAEESHPAQAAQIYVEAAERLIAQRSRDNYASAAGYLARLKPLYERMGAPERWAETTQRLRTQHKNLPAMKDEFNRAGLP